MNLFATKLAYGAKSDATSNPDGYPPIGTSLGHFCEHGNGRAMFRLQYPQHSYLSDLTGKPRMRKNSGSTQK